jgi:hypothetical protein
MKQSLSKSSIFYSLIVLVLLGQSALIVMMRQDIDSLKNDITTANSAASVQKENDESQTRLLLGQLNYKSSLSSVAIQPENNSVALHDLRIKLPYNDVTKYLKYSFDGNTEAGGGNYRVTSSLLNDQETRQLSCDWLLRINLSDGNPYSPWEESAGSVKLDDGRTIYLIAAKGFANEEASTAECASEVWTQVTPQQVADEFKKAQSY